MSPRAGLTPERVAAAAATLADRVGPDAVTLSAVADHLGVRTPSLYNHVDGLAGLRRAIALHALGELAAAFTDATHGRRGVDALQAICHAYRRYATTHPGRYAVTVTAAAPGDQQWQSAAQRVVQPVLDALAEAGVTGDDRIHAARALRAAVHGFVSLQSAGGFGLPQDVDTSFERLVGLLTAGLPAAGRVHVEG